jgi:integrase
MATINYLYRSTKDEAPLNVRLLFKDQVIGGKTRLKVSRHYWETTHQKNLKAIKDVNDRNTYNEVNSKLTELETFVLDKFEEVDSDAVNKAWLKSTIDSYYDPTTEKAIPQNIVNYIDYYLEYKKNDIGIMTVRRVRVIKHKLQRLEIALERTIFIKDINDSFKREFQDYYNKQSYSPNTQQREFKTIKSICYHASFSGLEVHPQLQSLKIKPQSVNHIYLTTDEIERISKVHLETEYLENARDWLIISCYTGQRVSDFLRFRKSMIRKTESGSILEFRQKKTGKLMSIPLLKEVVAILDKRGGEFPRSLSDQKYNDYIKDVAEAAELFELAEGKKRIDITPKEDKSTWRDVTGNYPKWQLVSSHIGRRSFATNHYGKVPTSVLIGITGHSSESQFLNYIQKSSQQTAIDAFEYFN